MKLSVDKFKVFGDTEVIKCPKCGDLVNMKILKSTSAIGAMGVSVLEYQIELFTVCPSCGSVFAVDKEVSQKAGKSKSNNHSCISEASLTYQTTLNYNA